MYWLEFKNDDEFPAPLFGSIGGGSATKFGIYQKAADGEVDGCGGLAQRRGYISLDAAVAYAPHPAGPATRRLQAAGEA